MKNSNPVLADIANDRVDFEDRRHRRMMRSVNIRERHDAKCKQLQAELDAMKPKSDWLQKYSDAISGFIRGAKCGYQLGNGRL